MSDSKITDKRGEDRPPRPRIIVYPRCPTCRHFEQMVGADGSARATVCVIDPPKILAQIGGQDREGVIFWESWCGFPVVNERTRCGKHSAADAN